MPVPAQPSEQAGAAAASDEYTQIVLLLCVPCSLMLWKYINLCFAATSQMIVVVFLDKQNYRGRVCALGGCCSSVVDKRN